MANITFATKENLRTIVTSLREELTNQNAFGKVTVDNTDVEADGVVDALTFVAGTNITITADAANDTLTFAATDTTYGDVVADATGAADSGLMASDDKYKLDNIEDGAEVNQNAFSTITVGADSIAADAKTDSFTVAAGTNVTVSVSGDTLTIAAADTTYALTQDANDGHILTFTPSVGQPVTFTIPDDNTEYDPAVASVAGEGGTDGLLTAIDKEKLDGIAEGAQVNVLEGVKVNGTALTATNKVVDVRVETGDAGVGTFKVNGTNVTPYGLGTAAAATVETTGISSNAGTLATTAQVKEYVDTTVTSAYKAAGSIAPAGVVSSLLVAANEGNVYNLSGTLTLDATSAALFVDGASGDVITAGTNLVVVKSGNDYKFDKMAGFVDLSDYTQFSDFGGLTAEDIAEILA